MEFINSKQITEQGLEFQLNNLESIEKFSLWNATLKKFHKEGEEIQTEQGTQKVSKYIKLSEEDKKHLGRKLTYLRKVHTNGEDKMIDLPKGAEDKLKEIITLMKEAEADPLDYTFIVSKTGTGLDTRYNMKRGDKIGKKGIVQSTILEQANDLDEKESLIVEVLKKNMTDKKLDSKQEQIIKAYVNALIENGIQKVRAEEIYDKYFK